VSEKPIEDVLEDYAISWAERHEAIWYVSVEALIRTPGKVRPSLSPMRKTGRGMGPTLDEAIRAAVEQAEEV